MKEIAFEGCRYRIVRSDGPAPTGQARWNLLHWVPTFGTSGAWHAEAFCFAANIELALSRLLGPTP